MFIILPKKNVNTARKKKSSGDFRGMKISERKWKSTWWDSGYFLIFTTTELTGGEGGRTCRSSGSGLASLSWKRRNSSWGGWREPGCGRGSLRCSFFTSWRIRKEKAWPGLRLINNLMVTQLQSRHLFQVSKSPPNRASCAGPVFKHVSLWRTYVNHAKISEKHYRQN